MQWATHRGFVSVFVAAVAVSAVIGVSAAGGISPPRHRTAGEAVTNIETPTSTPTGEAETSPTNTPEAAATTTETPVFDATGTPTPTPTVAPGCVEKNEQGDVDKDGDHENGPCDVDKDPDAENQQGNVDKNGDAESGQRDVLGIPTANPSHIDENGDGLCEKGEVVIKITPSGKSVRVPCQAAEPNGHPQGHGNKHSTPSPTPTSTP